VSETGPVFYYDLGSPESYLVAERIGATLPIVAEWEPVLGADLGCADPEVDREQLERVAAARGLQPVRWPSRWPPDTRQAMLVATYAKQIGRAVAFSLAAFRQAFAGGRDLSAQDTVLIAGAACEMHPTAVIRATGLRSVATALDRAADRAKVAGVRALPAVALGDAVFHGDAGLDEAVGALR
jgi:2-hydroxychromene-2-carboxylate isomerase